MRRFQKKLFTVGPRTIIRLILALCCILTPQAVFGDGMEEKAWQELEPGLNFAEFYRPETNSAKIVVLRFDPSFFDFTLHSTSEEGGPSKPLADWADKHNLVAAINASMYLPDSRTSTGYMRNGEHVNNGRISKRFGVFFVAGPMVPGLPSAALIDRDADPWQERLKNYRTVVQNYRMINADRRILWSVGGPLYAISAVGQDTSGNIFFIHCRQPVEAYVLCQALLNLPLNLRSLMYVEGGAQAGLAIRTKALSRDWSAPHMSGLLITGKMQAALPNIIGVKRKSAPAPESAVVQPATAPEAAQPAPPEGAKNQESPDSSSAPEGMKSQEPTMEPTVSNGAQSQEPPMEPATPAAEKHQNSKQETPATAPEDKSAPQTGSAPQNIH